MAKGVVLGLVETLLREFCIESSAPPGSHDVETTSFVDGEKRETSIVDEKKTKN